VPQSVKNGGPPSIWRFGESRARARSPDLRDFTTVVYDWETSSANTGKWRFRPLKTATFRHFFDDISRVFSPSSPFRARNLAVYSTKVAPTAKTRQVATRPSESNSEFEENVAKSRTVGSATSIECTHESPMGRDANTRIARANPSMRGPVSSEAVQILGRGLPHIPLAVGVGRSGPSQTCPRTIQACTRNTSSEPEAEGEVPLSAGSVRSVDRRDVIRSTIYSGITGTRRCRH
jgi:hypothetical protein